MNLHKIPILFSIFVCCFDFNPCIAKDAAKQDSVADESIARDALIRSLAIPGWGQWENERPRKALVFATLSTSLLLYAADAQATLSKAQSATQHEDLTAVRNTRILFFFLSNTLAAIDAYVDAHLADFSENYVLDTKTNTISLKLYRKF